MRRDDWMMVGAAIFFAFVGVAAFEALRLLWFVASVLWTVAAQ